MMDSQPEHGMITFWHKLEQKSVLQCPECRGTLQVSDLQFTCLSCLSEYPVESGVPLLIKRDEVISIPNEVMKAFNIPETLNNRVQAALTPLIKYRTHSHPEFANFFARFSPSAIQLQPMPLNAQETGEAVSKIECLTRSFPQTMRSGATEFRSLRIRNGSPRVLYTDERNPLYISYQVFTSSGEPVPCECARSPIPSPLRPGSELTIPVMVRLPTGVRGQLIVRFYFLLIIPTAVGEVEGVPDGSRPSTPGWTAWRDKLMRSRSKAVPDDRASQPVEHIHWFDALPLAEMVVAVKLEAEDFPADRRDSLLNFDVHEDVARADRFLVDVISKLKSAGISHPRILEVGSGVYPISLRACDENSTVIVSDISLVMQTLASLMHENNPAVLDSRAAFASFDMMYPPFRDGTFDIICICAAFHHIPYPAEFLKRLAPMLSVRGRFVAVREPCLVNPTEPTYISELANGFNEQMFELSEWKAIISEGGFTLDKAIIDFDCSLKFSARVASG